MKNDSSVKSFVEKNLWNFLWALFLFIVAFTSLQMQVASVEARQKTIEDKVAEYPSEDWFTLKFQTIEKSIDGLEKIIDPFNEGR